MRARQIRRPDETQRTPFSVRSVMLCNFSSQSLCASNIHHNYPSKSGRIVVEKCFSTTTPLPAILHQHHMSPTYVFVMKLTVLLRRRGNQLLLQEIYHVKTVNTFSAVCSVDTTASSKNFNN